VYDTPVTNTHGGAAVKALTLPARRRVEMIRSTVAPKVMWVRRARTLAFCVLAVLVVASIGMLLGAKPAHAATFSVNSMGDAGDNNPGNGTCATKPFQQGTEPECTLRAAIQEANVNGEADTIVFDSFLSGTIILSLGDLEVANDTPATDDLLIQGPGARKITVSGNDASRVFTIHKDTDATISGLTISDGRADTSYGGGIDNFATLTLTNTTVSYNTADFCGGGIASDRGTLTLTNTTVSNNTASCGGGIFNLGGGVLLTSNTVSNNTAHGQGGGGIANSGGTVRLTNTIVARNTATTNPDAGGTFLSRGNNLIGDTTGASGFGSSDLLNVNPLLGPLQDNGGPTDTRALLPGSPAVDAGNNTTCLFTDQRGEARKDGDGNGTVICDIGAFERNDLTPPKVTTTTPPRGEAGVDRDINLSATFSERMDRATLKASTFKLFRVNSNGNTTQITGVAVSSTTDGLKATLNPNSRLVANTEYKAVVTTAAKDRAGNRLDQSSTQPNNQPKEWTFTTGST
jgi:CSLREA domain-containing protein